MIIKDKDSSQEKIDYLMDLMDRDFPDEKKCQIERELKMLYSGDKGESSSAYYLDFDFKNAKNWMLLHDIRLEHNGDVAQIDHLLIGRLMDVYVIESKNFNYGVSISEDGDFSYFYKNKPISIPSPIQQNARHIRLLDKFLHDEDLIPKRLGIRLKPSYKNIVLISPNSRLSKPNTGIYDCSPVMKSDRFFERFQNDAKGTKDDTLDSMVSLSKCISADNLQILAEKIALHHKPAEVDYISKFKLKESLEVSETKSAYSTDLPICDKCGSKMMKRIAKKGNSKGNEFWGCLSFPKCKNIISIGGSESKNTVKKKEASPLCPKCNKIMIKRTAKKGGNTGNSFWGCSAYPKCDGSTSITASDS